MTHSATPSPRPSIDARLKELGLVLPRPFEYPKRNRTGFVQVGTTIYCSGHPPAADSDGAFPRGKVGAEISEEQGYQHARSAALMILSSIAARHGSLDNLKRAIQAAETTEIAAGADPVDPRFAPFLGGVRATAQLFESKMQSLGLTPVPAVGQAFDPELHEAVEIVPVSPELDNQVTFEYQTGYRLGERLLRPARVRVGRA